jgi:hypothetical protein
MSARVHQPGQRKRTWLALGFFLAIGPAALPEVPTPDLDCRNNQKMIVGALWGYSLENKVPPGHTVLLANLAGYCKNQRLPSCPLGGTYPAVLTVTREPLDVEKTPICSLGTSEQHLERANERRESATLQRARWLAVVVAVVILSPLLLAWRRRMARVGQAPSETDE